MQSRDQLLGRTIRSTGRWVPILVVVALLQASTSLLLPATLGDAVDAALGKESETSALVLLCVLVVLNIIAQAAAELVEVKTSTRATARLRHRVVRHVFAFDLGGQQRFSGGDLLSRLLESTVETGRAASMAVTAAVSLSTSVGGLVALLLIDIWVGVVFLVSAPVAWLLVRGFMGRATLLTEGYQSAHSDLATRFLDAVSGALTIRASGTAEREITRILGPLRDLRTHGFGLWQAQRDIGWHLSLLGPVLQIGVLATAGYGVVHGRVSPGDLIAVSMYLGYAFGIFRQLTLLSQFGRLRGSAGRVSDVLAVRPPSFGSQYLPQGQGALHFDNVAVTAGGDDILEGVDLDIPGGTSVAVVGGSGAGKSVLAAVAGGLRQPDAGAVSIDGVPLNKMEPAEVRRTVAFAFERPVLLGETLADAISYGDGDVSPEAVSRAVRSSRAESFIERLPDGLATPISDLRLSGGEVQRLGLARATCRDARILILDDAMSSLDMVTEHEVSQALESAEQSCTRLVVAHRMSTAKRADLTVWIEGKHVRAVGPHDELVADPDYLGLFGDTAHPDEQVSEGVS